MNNSVGTTINNIKVLRNAVILSECDDYLYTCRKYKEANTEQEKKLAEEARKDIKHFFESEEVKELMSDMGHTPEDLINMLDSINESNSLHIFYDPNQIGTML